MSDSFKESQILILLWLKCLYRALQWIFLQGSVAIAVSLTVLSSATGNFSSRAYEEISADYNEMICAATCEEIEARSNAFIRKWRLKHRAVADSLDVASEKFFTFTRLPLSQWCSVRTTNALLHEEFKPRIKTQTALPSVDTAAMLFWALLASE